MVHEFSRITRVFEALNKQYKIFGDEGITTIKRASDGFTYDKKVLEIYLSQLGALEQSFVNEALTYKEVPDPKKDNIGPISMPLLITRLVLLNYGDRFYAMTEPLKLCIWFFKNKENKVRCSKGLIRPFEESYGDKFHSMPELEKYVELMERLSYYLAGRSSQMDEHLKNGYEVLNALITLNRQMQVILDEFEATDLDDVCTIGCLLRQLYRIVKNGCGPIDYISHDFLLGVSDTCDDWIRPAESKGN